MCGFILAALRLYLFWKYSLVKVVAFLILYPVAVIEHFMHAVQFSSQGKHNFISSCAADLACSQIPNVSLLLT